MNQQAVSKKKSTLPPKRPPFRRRRAHCPMAKSTFTSYMDEGFMHFRAGRFEKSLTCYDRALEMKPTHKGALVARSQCYLKVGNAAAALQDAADSFDKNDADCINGVFQYADALFHLGLFEKALIVFFRGRRYRQDMDGFRIGIQKTKNALRVSIGDRTATQIEDYEKILPQIIEELESMNNVKKGYCCIRPGTEGDVVPVRKSTLKPADPARERWVSREVLGEMYRDKDYLSRFVRRRDLQVDLGTGHRLLDRAGEALKFLNVREKFWRTHTPMYARRTGLNFNNNMIESFQAVERQRMEDIRRVKMEAAEGSIMKNLALIDHALDIGRPNDCRLECDRTIRQMKKMSPGHCPRKPYFLCQVLHYKGRALMKLLRFGQAAEAFSQEYEISMKHEVTEFKTQALDFTAKALCLRKSYMEACELWELMLSTAKTSLERTYLDHEIGRCYMEMGKKDFAYFYGQSCIDEAAKTEDNIWLTNGHVFMAQLELKNVNLEKALEHFELADKYATRQRDNQTSAIIRESIHFLSVWMEKIANPDPVVKKRKPRGSEDSNYSDYDY